MDVVIYARVSKADKDDPNSIPIQLQDCREHAASEGWGVLDEFVDEGVSAWTSRRRRPAFERMIADLRAPTILVREQERLLRDMKDAIRLQELAETGKLRRIACTLEADIDFSRARDRNDFRKRASDAQFYSDFLSEKIRRTTDRKKERGEWAGGGRRPFGYQVVGPKPFQLVPDPREADLLREAARRVLVGESLHSTVRRWNDGPEPAQKDSGSRWTITDVRRVLLSEQAAGLRGGVQGSWEAILDRETHELLKVRLNDPSRRRPVSEGQVRRWALAGLMRCGECGTRMMGTAQNRNGRVKRAYVCSTANGGCGRAAITAPHLERYVIEWALENVPEEEPEERRVVVSEDEAEVLRELRELEERRRGLGTVYAEGLMDASQVGEATRTFDAEIARLQGRLQAAPPRRPSRRFLRRVEAFWDFVEGRTDELSEEEVESLNAFLRTAISAVQVRRARALGVRFNPERVEIVPS